MSDNDSTQSDDTQIIELNTLRGKDACNFKLVNSNIKRLGNDELQLMLDIIFKRSKISLRILDWFVTTYSIMKNIRYRVKGKEFNVYLNYKSELKTFKKRHFDPFKRKKKFYYEILDTRLLTTIGQLNFFYWAITNDVIEYVDIHYDEIFDTMKAIIKNKKVNSSETVNDTVSDTKSSNSSSVYIPRPKKKRLVLSLS